MMKPKSGADAVKFKLLKQILLLIKKHILIWRTLVKFLNMNILRNMSYQKLCMKKSLNIQKN